MKLSQVSTREDSLIKVTAKIVDSVVLLFVVIGAGSVISIEGTR